MFLDPRQPVVVAVLIPEKPPGGPVQTILVRLFRRAHVARTNCAISQIAMKVMPLTPG
jgi:hypothetical protein